MKSKITISAMALSSLIVADLALAAGGTRGKGKRSGRGSGNITQSLKGPAELTKGKNGVNSGMTAAQRARVVLQQGEGNGTAPQLGNGSDTAPQAIRGGLSPRANINAVDSSDASAHLAGLRENSMVVGAEEIAAKTDEALSLVDQNITNPELAADLEAAVDEASTFSADRETVGSSTAQENALGLVNDIASEESLAEQVETGLQSFDARVNDPSTLSQACDIGFGPLYNRLNQLKATLSL